MYTSVFAGLKSRQDSVSSIEDGFFYGSDGLEDDFEVKEYDPEQESSVSSNSSASISAFAKTILPARTSDRKSKCTGSPAPATVIVPNKQTTTHTLKSSKKKATTPAGITPRVDSFSPKDKTPRQPLSKKPPFGSPLARRLSRDGKERSVKEAAAAKKDVMARYQILLTAPIYSVIPPPKTVKLYSTKGGLSETLAVIPPNSEEWLHVCAMKIQEAINLENFAAELKARVEHLKALTDVHETSCTRHHVGALIKLSGFWMSQGNTREALATALKAKSTCVQMIKEESKAVVKEDLTTKRNMPLDITNAGQPTLPAKNLKGFIVKLNAQGARTEGVQLEAIVDKLIVMGEGNIKIAVRVRPFNSREKDSSSKLVVDMSGATTTLLPPPTDGKTDRKYEPKSFTFDYSYWTHDNFRTDDAGFNHPNPNSNYSGQAELFKDVGGSIMDNAWGGFNTTLLAYGQTGSGKSYSMFGYGANKGLIPMFCEDLFVMIEKKKLENNANIEYKVTYSMLEIYQDKVRDLLSEDGGENLKVRNHPKLGFYVENLKSIPVFSYSEIERLVDKGTKARTVASTRMNATSSRSHTIIVISFSQVNKADNTEKKSLVNLVDLAGYIPYISISSARSERQGDTKSEGKTLKEGANINSSLTALGQVISTLVQKQNDPVKNKSVIIPYRNSTLTKLLANSLGGNSKTIMIGAISPAHDAYEDTLSTLRFLAKGIKNVATVNENPVDKRIQQILTFLVIRELKEENEALKKKLLADAGGSHGSLNTEEIKRQIAEQEIAMRELNKSWAQKLEEAMNQKSLMDSAEQQDATTRAKKKTHPFFENLNEDPLLSGKILACDPFLI
ncbi:MAG: hypothetical protein SGCHY_003288 [Lobulomycetales sp.]